jgi:peptide/nickel transport system substrate-binding protein
MWRASRRGLVASTALVSLAALSGCGGHSGGAAGGGSTAGGGGSTSGGSKDTLTIAMSADIQGWDPTTQPDYQGWANQAVYDAPFRCNANAQPVPDIATSWAFTPGNMGVTLHLRQGMKFSDGAPVNADAIKANLQYAQKNGGGAARLAGWKLTSSDPQTAVITTAKPDPLLTVKLCALKIVSPNQLKPGKVNAAPIGSGPYKLDSSATSRGSTYVFDKDPSYWNAKAFPYKKLVIKVIPSETAAANALRSGQIDGTIITQATYNEAKASGLNILTFPHSETTRLLITDHDGKKIPALGSLDVRRAMNMVFDKSAIASKLYQGHAAPANQIFRPGSAAYIPGLKDPYPYNVAQAKALMAKAGYANGFTLEIPYMQGVANLDSLLAVVSQQLGLLNIKVKRVTLSGPNAIAELLSGKYPVPLWPLGNYGESKQDINDYVLPDGIWNVSHEKDPTIAKLYQTVLHGDAQQADAAQKAMNRYVTQQAWFVPMAYPQGFYAYNPKVVDLTSSSDWTGLQPQLWDFH